MNAAKRRKLLRKLTKGQGQHVVVKGWADLALIPESATHVLEIDVEMCNGWVRKKGDEGDMGHYLSTHTFYGSTHRRSTLLLRRCGFNVTLSNWDAEPNE